MKSTRKWLFAITFSTTAIQEELNVRFSHVPMAKVQPLPMMRLKVSVKGFVIFSIVKDSRGRVSALSNLRIIKEEVINLKENLQSIESDDPQLNKLHNRVYDLKMSLLNVDNEIKELNFLTKKDIQRSQTLLILKDNYIRELRTLEMVL